MENMRSVGGPPDAACRHPIRDDFPGPEGYLDRPPPAAVGIAFSTRTNMERSRSEGRNPLPSPASVSRSSAVRLIAVVLLALAGGGGVIYLARAPRTGQARDLQVAAAPTTAPDPKAAEKARANLFVDWPEPDLVFVLSGQSHGYLQPCGCSHPQYGGLARRMQFLNWLKSRNWPTLAVELGDMVAAKGQQDQVLLKYDAFMKALDRMGYAAVTLGKHEYLLPVSRALGQYALNHPTPRTVVTNLGNTDEGQLFHALNVRRHEIVDRGGFKVGILAAVGPALAEEILKGLPPGEKRDVQFLDNRTALTQGLAELAKQKTQLGILLYQGTPAEATKAAAFAWKLHQDNPGWPYLHAILCLDEASEPPSQPQRIDGIPTQIITVGHKGRYVGALGVYRKDRNLELRYQLVRLGPEFEPTAADEKTNPVLGVMEEYARQVRARDLLGKVTRSPHRVQVDQRAGKASYVGSERCADCHAHAYKIWEASRHSHAYDTLVEATLPSLRQYDPECVVCHVVGLQHPTGFGDAPADASARVKERHDLKLRHVGCESCHGPAGAHVNNPTDATLYPVINPYRASEEERAATTPESRRKTLQERRLRQIDFFCQKCHDEENDVQWGKVSFHTKWVERGIIHQTPPRK